MNFNLKTLQLFTRAAELGAIGRAGEDLSISATNASARIRALEEEAGTKLFHRTTRAISLTPDGELFLSHANRILDEVEDAKAALSTKKGKLRGELRLTAPVSFAKSHITPFIPEFLASHPDLSINLHLSDGVVDIVDQGYDLAFRIGNLAPSSLIARKIDDNPVHLVAAPSYLDRMGTPKVPNDLAQHNCFTLGNERKWRLQGETKEVFVVDARSQLRVNVGDAIAEWVLDGHGIGLASLWHAGPDLKAGRLRPVLPNFASVPSLKIWSVRPPGRAKSMRQQLFLEFMQERIRRTNADLYGDLVPEIFPRISR